MRVKIIEADKEASKKLRVCAYCRVSTSTEQQALSLENQTSTYERLIKSNPNYEFAGIYYDRAMTGSKEKRTGFNKMLEDARMGKIDLIITKSISRFARNTVIVLKYSRELKEKGIGFLFEEENINTLSKDGEIMLSVLSSFAQEELRSMSENQKWTIRKKYENGIAEIKYQGMMGYYKNEKGEFVIDEHQAEIVRNIYLMYINGLSTVKIAKKLNEENVLSYKGGKWSPTVVGDLIKNEKYKGDFRLQKFFSPEPNIKKRNKGNITSYYIEDNHQPIVSREIWDKAQQVMAETRAKRKIDVSETNKYQNRYPLSGMLICPYCGSTLRRRCVHNGRVEWWCSKSIRESVKACKGIHVKDEDAMAQHVKEPTVVKEMLVNGEKCYSYTPKSKYEFSNNEKELNESEKTKNGSILQSVNRQRRTVIKL